MKFGELKLAWLEALVETAELEKRDAAASRMGVNASDVTRYLDHLERWTGTILLVPNTKAQLTMEGVRFLPIAEEIVEKLWEFQEDRRRLNEAAAAAQEAEKPSAPAERPKLLAPPKRAKED